jgi:hypothetical protein
MRAGSEVGRMDNSGMFQDEVRSRKGSLPQLARRLVKEGVNDNLATLKPIKQGCPSLIARLRTQSQRIA